MRKFASHIVSLIVCLGIFVNTSAAVLSSLPVDLKIEISEESTNGKETVELSESILQEKEELNFLDVYTVINHLTPENLEDNRVYDSLSKGKPLKLHALYESYLI